MGGEIGFKRSPEEIEGDAVTGDEEMVIRVAFKEVGLDGFEFRLVEDQRQECQGEQTGLGVAGDEDPRPVKEIAGVVGGEGLESTGYSGPGVGPRPDVGPTAGVRPENLVEEREAGERGNGRRSGEGRDEEMGDGGEVRCDVDGDGEGDEESAAEEEDLVSA